MERSPSDEAGGLGSSPMTTMGIKKKGVEDDYSFSPTIETLTLPSSAGTLPLSPTSIPSGICSDGTNKQPVAATVTSTTATTTVVTDREHLKQRIAAVVANGGGRFIKKRKRSATITTSCHQRKEASPEPSSPSWHRILVDILLYPILAALLIHGPGLRVKWHFEELWPRYVESLVGAAVEGAFLLLAGTFAFVCGLSLHGTLEKACFERAASSAEEKGRASLLLGISCLTVSFFAAAWSFVFVLSAILGDAAFRAMTGNESPGAEMPRAWMGITRTYWMVGHYHDAATGGFWSLVLAMGCLAGGVWVFLYPLRKYHLLDRGRWNRRRISVDGDVRGNSSGNGSAASASGSSPRNNGSSAPHASAKGAGPAVAAAMRDIESRLGEAEKTSAARCCSPTKPKWLGMFIGITHCVSCVILGCGACQLNSLGWYTPVIFAYFSIFWGQGDMMTAMDVKGTALSKLSSVVQPAQFDDAGSSVMGGDMQPAVYSVKQQLSLAHGYQQEQIVAEGGVLAVKSDTVNSIIENGVPVEQQLPPAHDDQQQQIVAEGGVLATTSNTVNSIIENGVPEPSSPCDDILLYLPDPTAPVSRQFNGFFGAAMLSTFADKALVVMDAPLETVCPGTAEQGGEFPPLGLADMVEIPDWLTRKCAVPCRSTHSFDAWTSMLGQIRQRLLQSENAPSLTEMLEHVVCPNEDGRHAKVSVVGSHDVHEYFNRHWGDAMANRIPSPQASEWAMRLGASPEKAQTFSYLQGQAMWDYAAALMVQNGILRLTTVVERDVNEYIQNEMDAGTNLRKIYDAIEVKRGPSVLENAEAREYAQKYWASPEAQTYIKNYWLRAKKGRAIKRGAPHDYVPLTEYLRHIRDVQCDDDVHRVYVATNDPVGVMYDIKMMGPQTKGGSGIVHIDECHRVRFTVNTMSRNKEVEDGQQFNECSERYENNIANIADFVVLRQAETYGTTFYSDWGKLVRNFRLILNDQNGQEEEEGGPVLLKNMVVAWGRPQPGPP